MDAVISIVSWNTQDLLRNCLASLRRHVDPAHARVVVIDNASKDGTPEMVRKEFPEVTLIESGGNLGFGRAHNLIRKVSEEPFILFLNPDTEFVEDSCAKMVAVMKADPKIGLSGCCMVNLDHSVQALGFQWHTSPGTELFNHLLASWAPPSLVQKILPSHDPLQDGRVKKLYGGGLMARRSVLEQVGWFDERFFMYGEDVDMSRRVEQGGYGLYYLASTKVIHLCGGASAKAPGRFATVMQCESISKLMSKYYGSVGRSVYVATVFIRSVVMLAAAGALRMIGLVVGARLRRRALNSWLKHVAMFRWSVGLTRAEVPK